MFYVPYRFRRQSKFCVPKGPDFNRAPKIKMDLNGTEVSLNVPGHKTTSSRNAISPERTYKIGSNLFESYSDNAREWGYLPLIFRIWDFNGPWFIGNKAEVRMNCGLIQLPDGMNQISLFNPRAFESVIADILRLDYGHKLSLHRGAQDWFVPKRWQPMTSFPACAVSFDACENRVVASDGLERHFMIPLSDHYLLALVFRINRGLCYIHSDTEPEANKDDWISEEPMKVLADQVMGSLQVKLSPEAEQQQQRALAGLEDRNLVKEFAPLKWI